MRKYVIIFLVVFWYSCDKSNSDKLEAGFYKGILTVQDDEQLPFIFKVHPANKIEIYNAAEVIEVDDIEYIGDSIVIKLPYFRTLIAGRFTSTTIEGNLIEEDRDRIVSFSAKKSNNIRFETEAKPEVDVTGVWETEFDNYGSIYPAKAVLKQVDEKVTGTFRTNTGDYRFLEGVVDGNTLKLSTFDGAHAFLFIVEIEGDEMLEGIFYSGNHSRETFFGKRNANFELEDSNKLTFLKEGYDAFEFSFPDIDGNLVSLSDEQFKNKVVLVQIMGSYCPNCLDESKFYSEYYKNLNRDDFEIVALAFENAKTKEKAIHGIKRMRDRVGINYPILLAQIGTNSKSKANEKLPMLNHVLSYPTTIYIDKKGTVRKIHTGFNGPATGDKYLEFKDEFDTFVKILLNE